MEVKQVKISELKPHWKNPRIHPDSAIDRLVKSITEEEIVLTDEEKCQLFLIDFEGAITKKLCPYGAVKHEWKPNEWGIKLLQFIKKLDLK